MDRVTSTVDVVDCHSGDVADAKVRRLQEGPHPRQLERATLASFVSGSVNMTLRSVCSNRSDDSQSTSSVHESSGLQADGTVE